MKSIIYIIGILFYLLTGPLNAQVSDGMLTITDGDNIHDISGLWKFRTEDHEEFKDPDYDVSKWSYYNIQDTWAIVGVDYYGTAWFRLNIDVEISGDIPRLSIILPFHYNYLEVYLNGQKINRIPRDFRTNPAPRPTTVITLPSVLMHHGKNVLSIRTSAHDGLGGFRSKFFRLGPHDKIMRAFSIHLIYHTMLGMIPIAFAIYFLFFYFQRTDDIYYLFFSGLGLALGLWILGFRGIALYIFPYQASEAFFSFASGVLLNAFSLHFIHSFYKLKEGYLAWLLNGIAYFIATFVILEFIFRGSTFYSNTYLLQAFLLTMFLYPFYVTYINIIALRRKLPFAERIFFGSMVYVGFTVYSILGLLGVISTEPKLNEGFFFMTLIFANVLSLRFSEMHKDLEKAHKKLLTLDKLKDEFLAITSHELRTPLNGIIGLAESTLEMVHSPGTVKRNVNMIVSSGRRLSYLVDDILDFSRLKSADLEIQIHSVDGALVAELVAAISEPLAHQKGLDLILDFPGDLPRVAADENRLQQILLNLVGNAIKFTPSGNVILRGERTDEGVRFSVQDTGIGIPQEKQDEIFESFKQIDGTVTRKYGGTGLGLSIVKSLLRLHNSDIHLRSRHGEGSEFSFVLGFAGDNLPVANIHIAENIVTHFTNLASTDTDQLELDSLPKTNVENNNNSSTIMIVDDDPLNIQLMKKFLQLGGFTVKYNTDGLQSVHDINMEKPDLILLDLMMPNISGLDLCRIVREKYSQLDLPVIIISANKQVSEMEKAFEAGANDYLTKPINRNELIARVKLHLNLQ